MEAQCGARGQVEACAQGPSGGQKNRSDAFMRVVWSISRCEHEHDLTTLDRGVVDLRLQTFCGEWNCNDVTCVLVEPPFSARLPSHLSSAAARALPLFPSNIATQIVNSIHSNFSSAVNFESD